MTLFLSTVSIQLGNQVFQQHFNNTRPLTVLSGRLKSWKNILVVLLDNVKEIPSSNFDSAWPLRAALLTFNNYDGHKLNQESACLSAGHCPHLSWITVKQKYRFTEPWKNLDLKGVLMNINTWQDGGWLSVFLFSEWWQYLQFYDKTAPKKINQKWEVVYCLEPRPFSKQWLVRLPVKNSWQRQRGRHEASSSSSSSSAVLGSVVPGPGAVIIIYLSSYPTL